MTVKQQCTRSSSEYKVRRPAAADIKPIVLGNLHDGPLVSILTSNHNYGTFVGDAIESVLSQTYPHFEMIICDDGSTDRSLEFIEPYTVRDQRIRLIAKSNGGQASAWNRAYSESSGDIICILDSDDLFEAHKLEAIVQAFRWNPHAGLLVHPMNVIDSDGTFLWQTPQSPGFEQGWIGPKVLRRGGGWKGMFGSALSFRRELADLVFPIPESIGPAHADAFLVQIAPLLTPVAGILEPLTMYRFHGENITNDATESMDVQHLRSRAERGLRVGLAINERLKDLGYEDRMLPVPRDSSLAYLVSLVDSSTLRERISLLLGTLKGVLKEDYHSPQKRASKMVVFTLPLVLPKSYRKKVLDRFFSARARSFTQRRFGFPGWSSGWRQFVPWGSSRTGGSHS